VFDNKNSITLVYQPLFQDNLGKLAPGRYTILDFKGTRDEDELWRFQEGVKTPSMTTRISPKSSYFKS